MGRRCGACIVRSGPGTLNPKPHSGLRGLRLRAEGLGPGVQGLAELSHFPSPGRQATNAPQSPELPNPVSLGPPPA